MKCILKSPILFTFIFTLISLFGSAQPPLNLGSTPNVICKDSTYTITWSGGASTDTVRIYLADIVAFTSELYIGQNLPNTGSFTWTAQAGIFGLGLKQFYIENTIRTRWDYGSHFNLIQCCNATYATIYDTACGQAISPSTNYIWNQTGIYLDTLTNTGGCDSIISYHLTINSSDTTLLNQTACGSFFWGVNSTNYLTTGVYFHTISSTHGCDSVLQLNLTVQNSTSANLIQVACHQFVSPSGNFTWNTTGVYQDTILNSWGCDSVISIQLTIHSLVTYDTLSPVACINYISPSGLYTWSSSGTYTDTIPNQFNCDSIITIHLTIGYPSVSSIHITTCENYSSPSNNHLWTSTGIYHDTLTSQTGCDSIIIVHLTINTISTSTLNLTSCHPITSPSGNYLWQQTGTFLDTVSNAMGCDSIITALVIINPQHLTQFTVSSCDFYTSPSGNHIWNNTGVYFDTLTNVFGCDSILEINILLNQSSFDT